MFSTVELYRQARVVEVSERFILELILARVKGKVFWPENTWHHHDMSKNVFIADPELLRWLKGEE